ncbi:hypothetical protein D3C78_488880 [compost metagenome]
MRQQTFDKVLIKVREFMSVMLIYLTQNTLGAVLVQFRQGIKLNKLTQLLRHDFAFNHEVANKSGTIRQLQRLQQHTLRVIFTSCLPVKLIKQQQVAVEIAH